MQNQIGTESPTVEEKIVIAAEHERIKQRRQRVKLGKGSPERDAIGLTLSGGGIRSASFNLGLLQALQRYGFLKYIDYLSTVSGGGYIGSSLTWFMSGGKKEGSFKERFPFGTERKDNFGEPGRIVSWIRQHASYLTPGRALGIWALISIVLRGMFINFIILVPIFFAMIYFMTAVELPWPSLLSFFPIYFFPEYPNSINGFIVLLNIGILFLLVLGFSYVLYALFSGFRFSEAFRLRYRINSWMGLFLRLSVLLVITGTVPLVYAFFIERDLNAIGQLAENWRVVGSSFSMSVMGILSLLAGLRGRTVENESKRWRRVLLSVGFTLLLYGLLLWVYHSVLWGALWLKHHPEVVVFGITLDSIKIIYGAVLGSILLGALANINYVSIHRYYRDRLLEAFMPESPEFKTFASADKVRLKDLQENGAPYQIINCLMMTLNSKNKKLSLRGGGNFIFSPLYCGTSATGYAPTEKYLGGTMDLATAFSISGAAIDPNTGVTRSRPLGFWLTLLNIRLGYWARNPKKPADRLRGWSRPYWLVYTLRELLGFQVDENQWHVYLSDGGHFENLGLYELVRRQCRLILVSDAGADPKWTFADLANAIEKVRVDFGVHISIDTHPLEPEGTSQISRKPFVIGDIQYADGRRGTLLYLKSSVIGGLPEDIYGYRRANPSFPDESTTDQFFNEPQFEAYRELGFRLGEHVCKDKRVRRKFKWRF